MQNRMQLSGFSWNTERLARIDPSAKNRAARRTKSAFTLVELLVVIALIATLVAMLFPVFGAARGKARQAVCASNLQQIGVAIALYAQDYDDRYPNGASVPDKHSYTYGVELEDRNDLDSLPSLQVILDAYTKNRVIWRCSSDTGYADLDYPYLDKDAKFDSLAASPSGYERYGTSYLYHVALPLLQLPYPANGCGLNDVETGPGQVDIVWDTIGSWHGGEKPVGGRYNALRGDGHIIVENTDARLFSLILGPAPCGGD